MVVRLRLQRHGRKGTPVYWIVATNVKARRDGKHIERLGTYHMYLGGPRHHGQGYRRELYVNEERLKYWFANGAQPTKPVEKIMVMLGMLPRKPIPPSHKLLSGVKKSDLPPIGYRRPKWTKDPKWNELKEARNRSDSSAAPGGSKRTFSTLALFL